ncbi:MAG: cation:proton antiporter [Bacteroidetes bacterium]|nr:cation:proton antiporter [Bacteroidota bacterium]
MEIQQYIKLPVTDPVLVFTIVLLIILFAPLLLRKINVPSIVGFIIAGVIFGPFGLNVLERNDAIVLFGTVGLIYIMFLAGLDLDFNEFRKSKYKSLLFGILTFLIPFLSGIPVCYYILRLDLIPSILVASMFSTHTLVAYPIVSRMGVTRNEAVVMAVGGTIITDVLVLLILAIVIRNEEGNADVTFWVRLFISLLVFGFIVFWSFPKITRWFLKNLESEKTIQYIFILTLLFVSAFLSKLAGIEPILGAFVAGITLNRFIPYSSALMNRIEFVGNALFIPFFLISVGMLVDLKVLFDGYTSLFVIVVLTSVALIAKWLAAYFTQKLYRLSTDQRRVLFGLSSSHAAATLAVITIGYNIGLVNIHVLNGTIVLVFITCLVASFVTEKGGRNLAKIDSDKISEEPVTTDKILVPIHNPSTIERLLDLAIFLKDKKSRESIYPLTVVRDDEEAKEKIQLSNKMMEKAIVHASASDQTVEILTRIDVNVSSGISRTVRELMINCIIIGWSDKVKAYDKIFGTILTNILASCNQMLWVCKIKQPLNTTTKTVVLIPPNAEYEPGFINLFRKVDHLSKQLGNGLMVFSTDETKKNIQRISVKNNFRNDLGYGLFNDWENFTGVTNLIENDNLILILSARQSTISYHHVLNSLPGKLGSIFSDSNFILIYPEQTSNISSVLPTEDMTFESLQENINQIGKIGKFIGRIIRKFPK